jgi:hypothetical protein
MAGLYRQDGSCRCYAAGIAKCDEKWLAEIALMKERRRRGMTGRYRQDGSCRCYAAKFNF